MRYLNHINDNAKFYLLSNIVSIIQFPSISYQNHGGFWLWDGWWGFCTMNYDSLVGRDIFNKVSKEGRTEVNTTAILLFSWEAVVVVLLWSSRIGRPRNWNKEIRLSRSSKIFAYIHSVSYCVDLLSYNIHSCGRVPPTLQPGLSPSNSPLRKTYCCGRAG